MSLVRLLLEHALHLEALEVLVTVREEDILNVEGAYLEGWAYDLRAEALLDGSVTVVNTPHVGKKAVGSQTEGVSEQREDQEEQEEEEEEGGPERLTAPECLAEAMSSLIEAAKLFTEQDYPDEGIGAHIKELLDVLESKGVKPVIDEEAEGGNGEGGGDWEDLEENGDDDEDEDEDVEMA